MTSSRSPDRVTGPDGNRWYEVGRNRYPSVTTITGTYEQKKQAIEGFVQKVGEEEAERIKNYTALRGTLVHHRILNPIAMRQLPLPEVDMSMITDDMEEEIKVCEAMWDDLDYSIGEDPYVEKRTWSHKHGYAGTLDLLTEEGVITDLKTSKPTWAPSDTQRMQVSAYFHAAKEMDELPDPTGAAIVILHPDPEYNPNLTAKVERLNENEIDYWFGKFTDLLDAYDPA